jgi:catechol-2,3-dioxygenase
LREFIEGDSAMPKVTGLGHVGLYVKDPSVMVDFYSDFLGMTVTDRGENDRIVFLSARPEEEHHELALARSEDHHTDAQQISFTVGSLSDLRAFHAKIRERGYPIDRVVSHGNAFGCYFRDPEGNRVEVYWHTGKDWPQPYGVPIDLELSETELRHLLDEMPVAAPAS